nr:TniQ family protein [Acidipropionibacterium jensenii]
MLPIRVAPFPDEWATSWLRRLAWRYDIAPNKFFDQLGYRRKIYTVQAITTRLKTNVHGLADHLMLSELERAYLAAQPPLAQATRYYASEYGLIAGPTRSARFCPLCLAADPAYWRASWSQPLMLCCPEHHVALVNTCPGCHQILMTDRAWATAPIPLWQCTERLPGRPGSGKHRPRCDHDLRTAATIPVDDQTVEAQRYLLHLADTSDPGIHTVAGFRATRAQCFSAFVEILTDALPSGTDVLDPTTKPEEVLPALPVAAEILHAPNPHRAATIAHDNGILAPYGDTSPIFSKTQIRNRCHSPILVAIQLTDWADHLSKPDQLQFRTGHLVPRYPANITKNLSIERVLPELSLHDLQEIPYSSIPQALWPEALPPELRYLADTEFHHHAMSMCLAKVGSTRTWGEITAGLELPHSLSTSMNAFWRTLENNNHWPLLRSTLDHLATQLLDQPPPIDYSRRRRLAHTITDASTPADLVAFAQEHAAASHPADGAVLRDFFRLDEPAVWHPARMCRQQALPCSHNDEGGSWWHEDADS